MIKLKLEKKPVREERKFRLRVISSSPEKREITFQNTKICIFFGLRLMNKTYWKINCKEENTRYRPDVGSFSEVGPNIVQSKYSDFVYAVKDHSHNNSCSVFVSLYFFILLRVKSIQILPIDFF